MATFISLCSELSYDGGIVFSDDEDDEQEQSVSWVATIIPVKKQQRQAPRSLFDDVQIGRAHV